MRRRTRYLTGAAVVGLLLTGTAAGAAIAAPSVDVHPTFTTSNATLEYGTPWYFEATASDANTSLGEFTGTGTLTGAPSAYAPSIGAYRVDTDTVNAYMAPSSTARPLGVGTYTVSLGLVDELDPPTTSSTPAPAQLTITPAALGISLSITADPSNPANAIVAARFTGPFADNFFSTVDPVGPLTPAGTWTIRVSDADGEVAHELSQDRAAEDDVLGISSYWSDVPPGEYTARATFTPSGESADNFTIADATTVTYTAAAAPGSGSTAPPAPPAPPATEEAGMTLPMWVPIVAGVLTAGLLALVIVHGLYQRFAGGIENIETEESFGSRIG